MPVNLDTTLYELTHGKADTRFLHLQLQLWHLMLTSDATASDWRELLTSEIATLADEAGFEAAKLMVQTARSARGGSAGD